jgi:hypothetical protein
VEGESGVEWKETTVELSCVEGESSVEWKERVEWS